MIYIWSRYFVCLLSILYEPHIYHRGSNFNMKLQFESSLKPQRSNELLVLRQVSQAWGWRVCQRPEREERKNKRRRVRKARETREWCGRLSGGELWSPFWSDTRKRRQQWKGPCTPLQQLRGKTQQGSREGRSQHGHWSKGRARPPSLGLHHTAFYTLWDTS